MENTIQLPPIPSSILGISNIEVEDAEITTNNEFMSPCGIGLTPLPLGKHFSIIFQWNTEKDHIAHMI